MPDSRSERIKIAIFDAKTVCISYSKHIRMVTLGKPKITGSILHVRRLAVGGSRAFSSGMDTGSRKENALNQISRALAWIPSEPRAVLCRFSLKSFVGEFP